MKTLTFIFQNGEPVMEIIDPEAIPLISRARKKRQRLKT
jgi:hypothetical protein